MLRDDESDKYEDGAGSEPGSVKDPVLRFLLVDELERLILTILERSPNLKHED